MYPACVVMDEVDALFQGTNRADLFQIFGALRPRLKIRQPDEPRRNLPDLIPTQFVFAAATMLHIGPFSAGNMLIERFCTAHTVETRHFHRLPSGLQLENVRWVPGSDDWDRRVDGLLEVLRGTPCNRTLIFVNTLHNCHVLLKFLRDAGWPTVSFMKGPQGRMGPRFRDAQRFVQGEANIMIATEFGGRGIDWAEVDHVINFQMPTSAVCWLHRVGRTGRIGRTGVVTSFVAQKDKELADLIRTRLVAGKDLHGAFSRRRSLSRRLKSLREERAEGGEGEEQVGYSAEAGSYRLHGGLELFERGLAASAGGPSGPSAEAAEGSEGTLIGYLASAQEDVEPGVAARRWRQRAREAARPEARPRRGGGLEDAQATEGAEPSDALLELRRQFLASDSESDGPDVEDGAGPDSDNDSEDDLGEDADAAAAGSQASGFSWGQIDDAGDGAVVGPKSRRQLLNRSQHKEPGQGSRQYLRQDGSSSGRGRQRSDARGRGRSAAAKHYAEPDDELLL